MKIVLMKLWSYWKANKLNSTKLRSESSSYVSAATPLSVWMSDLMLDTCIFHVFVQQVLQVLLLVIVELSLQSQQDVFI